MSNKSTSHYTVQWVLDYPKSNHSNAQSSERLDVAMFSAAAAKRHSGHWSSTTGKIKQSCCMNNFSLTLQCFCHAVLDLVHDI